jgi:hypothetical protein
MHPKIGPLPWLWTRRQIAERWHVPPWEVDEAPECEIALELQLMQIEGEERPKQDGS